MTIEEAIRILDPETSVEELLKIEYYGGFGGRTKAAQALSDACILAVAALREQEERRWIPVTERLPENICPVLVALEGISTAFNGWYHDGKWWTVGAGTRPFTQKVTHWMPLPKPPKGE